MHAPKQAISDKPIRVSVVTDIRLLDELRAHQRRVREQSGMRVSLSQVACSLLRRGLDQAASATA